MNRADGNSPGILVSITPEELKILSEWFEDSHFGYWMRTYTIADGPLENIDSRKDRPISHRDLHDDIRHLMTQNGVK